jgi:hypothetical protein
MSLLPTSTYAGPSQAEALWAVAGAVGPDGGVTQLVAGDGIILDPSTGEGVVTISVVGGGGGGDVTSIVAGPGIGVSSPAGDVTVSNTGVTSLLAGSGISLSAATGTITVTNTGQSALATNMLTNILLSQSGQTPTTVTQDFIGCGLQISATVPNFATGCIANTSWNLQTDAFFYTPATLNFGSQGQPPNPVSVQILRIPAGLNNPSYIQIQVWSSVNFVGGTDIFTVTGAFYRLPGRNA